MISEELLSHYIDQLLLLYDNFSIYYGIIINQIFPFLYEITKSSQEDIALKSLILLSQVSNYISNNSEISSLFIQLFVENIAKVDDFLEWDNEKDQDSYSTTCRNLFGTSSSFSCSFLLESLTTLKDSLDLTNWKFAYSLLAGFSEVNWYLLGFRTGGNELITELFHSLCFFDCDLSNPDLHHRLK